MLRFNKYKLLFVTTWIALTGTFLFLFIFYIAYFTPTKATLVNVDYFGESHIEAFLVMPFLIVMTSLSLMLSYEIGKENVQEVGIR